MGTAFYAAHFWDNQQKRSIHPISIRHQSVDHTEVSPSSKPSAKDYERGKGAGKGARFIHLYIFDSPTDQMYE